MAREFPISNGKLMGDLDANGHKILNASGSVGATGIDFHALTPEISDTTLTLNPVDGRANWVEDVVMGCSEKNTEWRVQVRATIESVEDFQVVSYPKYTAEYGKDVVIRYNGSEFEMEWLHDVVVEGCTFKAGIYLFPYNDSQALTALYFDSSLLDGFVEVDYPWMLIAVEAECSRINPDFKYFVTLPAATDHARRFSLALETDADSEKEVIWSGGTVVEKFPGASKLAVGRTVWDVKEVSPDEFLVDRAPGASGISLTGDNGKAYTLGVDGDGVLEVRG